MFGFKFADFFVHFNVLFFKLKIENSFFGQIRLNVVNERNTDVVGWITSRKCQ